MNIAEALKIEHQPLSLSETLIESAGSANSECRFGIYLDFEGEGKKRDTDSAPSPHLAGVYRPEPGKSTGGSYTCYFFKRSWSPIKNGCASAATIIEFDCFLRSLISEAKFGKKTIYYWSHHELAMIERYASAEVAAEFKTVSQNSLRIAKKFANQRRIAIEEKHEKGLNNFLSALAPKLPTVKETKPGAAESCRRIDSYCAKAKRWRKWTDSQKLVARNLVSYNYEDCLALYRVTKKVTASSPKQHHIQHIRSHNA